MTDRKQSAVSRRQANRLFDTSDLELNNLTNTVNNLSQTTSDQITIINQSLNNTNLTVNNTSSTLNYQLNVEIPGTLSYTANDHEIRINALENTGPVGGGTVTSISVSGGLTSSPSPITTTGTISVDFAPSGTNNNTQVVRADDSRLSDARTPTSHTHVVSDMVGITPTKLIGRRSGGAGTGPAEEITVGNNLKLDSSGTLSADTNVLVDGTGTGIFSGGGLGGGGYLTTSRTLFVTFAANGASTLAIRDDDSRLTDARTPTAHTHSLANLTQSSANKFEVPQWNGTNWVAYDTRLPENRIVVVSDLNAAEGFVVSSSGTGASNVFTSSGLSFDGRFGILTSGTGSTATGRAGIGSAVFDQVVFGVQPAEFEAIVRIPTLSNATQRYIVQVGFLDNLAGISVDGLFFEYSDTVNAGKWLCQRYNNNANANADSGITVAANTWYKLKVVVSTTDSNFYINGNLVGTLNTIPTGTARSVGFHVLIRKTVGTTASSIFTDYMHFVQETNR